MIREATAEDIPDILIMGHRFTELSGWSEIAGWNAADVMAMLERLISEDDGILLVVDNGQVCGMAGAVLQPFHLNTAHKTGLELFFWVEPEARGREPLLLLDALENEARKRGAHSFGMVNVEGLRSDALRRLYERKGYRAMENVFVKVL